MDQRRQRENVKETKKKEGRRLTATHWRTFPARSHPDLSRLVEGAARQPTAVAGRALASDDGGARGLARGCAATARTSRVLGGSRAARLSRAGTAASAAAAAAAAAADAAVVCRAGGRLARGDASGGGGRGGSGGGSGTVPGVASGHRGVAAVGELRARVARAEVDGDGTAVAALEGEGVGCGTGRREVKW